MGVAIGVISAPSGPRFARPRLSVQISSDLKLRKNNIKFITDDFLQRQLAVFLTYSIASFPFLKTKVKKNFG